MVMQITSGEAPLLTVIVPVFNERATIDQLLHRVLTAPYTKQVVVVDDGSTDGTDAILSAWEREGRIEVFRHFRNRGKGRAIRTALDHASGRFVVIQDGDLETDPQDYSLLLAPLLEGRADFVIGSRFVDPAHMQVSVAPVFRIGVRVLNLAVRLLYGMRVSDEACCYKVFPTNILKAFDLQCERFDFCPEVVAKASRIGLRTVEVPVRYYPRTATEGKKLRYRDGLAAMRCLWRLRGWRPRSADNLPELR
jgi:dolichol-phosphate mannosyltransferase